MKRNLTKCAILMVILAAVLCSTAAAEEWTKVTLICPVCGAINTFQVVTGAPADVYERAERFQYIFWPVTDKRIIYSCKKCHYTVYMEDWNALPHEKSEAIHAALHKITTDTSVSDYTTIPMSARFAMAEQIYIAWGKDDAFMCAFYRAMAWHLDEEKMGAEAVAVRKKAIEIATKMLSVELKRGARKELLFIRGSMKHSTGDDAGALDDLKAAKEIPYEDEKDMFAPGVRRDQYLSRLIDELTAKIEKNSGSAAPAPKNDKLKTRDSI